MELSSEFTFRATHAVRIGQSREEPHEHSFKVVVTVQGPLKDDGFVIDFLKLRKVVTDLIISRLDGANLNEMFDQPSVENVGLWIFKKLKGPISNFGCTLVRVTLHETEKDWITVRESDL